MRNFTVASKRVIYSFSTALLFLATLYYVGEVSAAEPVIDNEHLINSVKLMDEQTVYHFSGKLKYFAERETEYSFEDVKSPQVHQQFQLLPQNSLSLGYMKSSVWLHFFVEHSQVTSKKWLLAFDYPLLDEIDVFSRPYKTIETQWQYTEMGDSKPYSQRPIEYRTFVLPLNFSDNQYTEFYVRINSSSAMQIKPSIQASTVFFTEQLSHEMFFGIIYGIMLLMALYNIFLFIATRDLSYFVYVVSVLSGCIFIMAINGHAYQYLWPNSPTFSTTGISFFASLWMTSTAIFTQMFLDTKQYTKRLHALLKLLIVLGIINIISCFFIDYQLAIQFAIGLAVLNGVFILITSMVCDKKGHRYAKYFAIAWVFYGGGTAMLVISRFGGLDDNFITRNSVALGLLIQIIMLTMALSVKYRVLTEQLKKSMLELENKVMQRTQELEESNKKLEKLSTYDSLTGIPNRRYFDEQFEKEWERAKRQSTPFSILICDIDEFKSINDHFGHQYGDECLQRIAKVLLNVLHRPADMPARFGGDEFVVILPDTLSMGAEIIAIHICEAIEDLMLTQAPDAMQPIVTLSIGCATLIPSADNDIKALFALADKNLFKAKDKGRNCVVS